MVRFVFFSLEPITEIEQEKYLTLDEIKDLIDRYRIIYKPLQPKARKILAENILDSKLNVTFDSLNELANTLKGDKATIRGYMDGTKKGYYRKQWKFTELNP